MFIRKVRQFHGLEYPADDHRCAQSGAEAQEKHSATLIASKGLHRSIIDDLDRTTECLAEIKPDPAVAQIVGLAQGPSMDHGARISDRDAVILPVLGNPLHIPHHFVWSHGWTRRNLALLVSSCCDFDIRSSYVNHQDPGGVIGGRSHHFFSTWPPQIRRRTIFAPLLPRPIIPICIFGFLPSVRRHVRLSALSSCSASAALAGHLLSSGAHNVFRRESEVTLNHLYWCR